MRQIKFRGKRKDGWVYGNSIDILFNGGEVWITEPNSHPVKVNPETVGQFTGLTDKNGKEIYEGSIIRFGEGDEWVGWGVVNYYPEKGAFQHTFQEYFWNDEQEVWEPDTDNWRPSKVFWQNPKMWIEVIGNIHDNPELI